MKFINGIQLSAIAALVGFAGSLSAAEFVLDGGDSLAKGGNRNVVLVGFTGNDEITDAQTDVTYDAAKVSVSVKSFGGAGCSNPKPGLVRVVSPDLGGKALGEKMGAYCQISVKSLSGPMPSNPLSVANSFCSGIGGVEKSCASSAEMSK